MEVDIALPESWWLLWWVGLGGFIEVITKLLTCDICEESLCLGYLKCLALIGE